MALPDKFHGSTTKAFFTFVVQVYFSHQLEAYREEAMKCALLLSLFRYMNLLITFGRDVFDLQLMQVCGQVQNAGGPEFLERHHTMGYVQRRPQPISPS